MKIAGRDIRARRKAKTLSARTNRCVLVADSARARLFTIEETNGESWPPLIERKDLVNPEGELTRNEKFSDTRSGRRGRSSVAGGGYSLDKRVERHEDEFDRRFAREVANGAAQFVRLQSAGQLVVAATPRFLGHLRTQFQRTLPEDVEVFEIPTDLTWHTSSRIARKLIQQGLLGQRKLPQAAYRPRAQQPAKKKPTLPRQPSRS